MMQQSIGTFIVLFCLAFQGQAQDNLDHALASIRKNNKAITAYRQYSEAQKLESRTGLAPDDPFISADYLIGRPVSGGNQVDIVAIQSFDFPTSYAKKRQKADLQAQLYELELRNVEQAVVWEAKQIALSIILLNKRKGVLGFRLDEAKELLDDFELKDRAGDIRLMDVNKARLRHLGIKDDLRQLESRIASETARLVELNGGIPISISDTSYPGPAFLPPVDSLEKMIQRNDIELRSNRNRSLIQEKQVEVSKALSLPKLETGYHYQSVLGQTFNGIHLGASVPLWQHRNKVKTAMALVEFRDLQGNERQVEIQQETRRLYQSYESLQESLTEYQTVLNALTSQQMLRKALELEEIDFITYAMELDFYFKSYDKLLEIEYDYHTIIADLLKSNL